ncbi:MAG: 3-hydroxyacyl-CoA dehydrogenase NAD-binding domain-containing protein, partial [Desulfomonilaceae bacterium]|nr:3-hydroxyacyl-CoA dehydrogenase NAD-binding domain-containing protein [Desulfomonilaceae bacterium]
MSSDNIFRLEKKGDIGIVTFDVAGQPMNTWTREAVEGFLALLDDLEKAADVRGVIFISGKPGVFHAGADLNMLDGMTDRAETANALDIFHNAFKRLEALSFPTLAAIDGHCLGGGLEFALSCTARIAKDSGFTKIGLPECSLGIFPGAGGTQRLPRLIGFSAIEPILRGTIFPAGKAHEMGIVDRLVPADGDLPAEALKFLHEVITDRGVLKRPQHDFSALDQVAEMARQGVLKVTKGREIPGPMLAIQSIRDGLKVSLAEGLEIEKNNFVEAVLSNQAKGSIHTFFLKTMSDKPKAMMTKGFKPKNIDKIALLGFGTMGRGIAVDILKQTRIPVVVKDVPEALEPGKAFVKKILDGMAEKKKLKEPVDDAVGRLELVSDYGDAFKDVDLVIEAVFEDIKVKEQVYRELCSVVGEDCVIATNTSSIPLDSMSGFVTNPGRFGGLHFFSPVWMMQLVEVVKGVHTDPATVDNLLNFTAAVRKRPIVCKDHPGFVVNAVLFPYFLSAMEFLEAHNSIENIDKAFIEFGMPIGPIRLTDEVGIDVCHNVLKGRGLKQDTLKNVVEAGRLGLKKSGKGFFLKDGAVDPDVLPLVGLKEERILSAEDMQTRVLTEMITVGKHL